MTSPKNKRIRFSIAKKVEILDLVRKGNPRTDICRTYAIASSTLFDFIKNEKKIRDEFESNRDSNRRLIRASPFQELEQAVVKWFQVAREKKVSVSGPMVQEQALIYAKEMGLNDFTASGGWLDRFKKRENLDFKARTFCMFCNLSGVLHFFYVSPILCKCVFMILSVYRLGFFSSLLFSLLFFFPF